jgi:hypothetical protein
MTTHKNNFIVPKISVFSTVIILLLCFSLSSCKPATQEAEKKQTSPKTDIKVGIDRAVIRNIEIPVDNPSITKVGFSIKDEKIAKMGVVLSQEETEVVNNKASAELMFGFAPGTPLGKYEVVLVIKNSSTGEIIGEKTIPFEVVPKDITHC